MNSVLIFVAVAIGVAVVMAIILCCFIWQAFKKVAGYRGCSSIYRRNVLEDSLLRPIIKAFCLSITLMIYLSVVALGFMLSKITLSVVISALVSSTIVGLLLFLIFKVFHKEIVIYYSKPKRYKGLIF